MTDNSGVKPPCNHEPWNPTLIIHADGRTEVKCGICGEVVPYKESAARPPSVKDIVQDLDQRDYTYYIQGIEMVPKSEYQALLAERDALKTENDKLFQNQVEWATEHPTYKLSKELEAENNEIRDQAEALAEALEMYERGMPFDSLMCDEGEVIHKEWATDALTAWRKFKGEGGTHE